MISVPNFNVYLKNNFINTKTQTQSLSGSFTPANLAPLKADTVVFTGRHSAYKQRFPEALNNDCEEQIRADKAISDYSNKANIKVAKSLYEELEFAHNRFKSDISQIFGLSVLDVKNKQFEDLYAQSINDNFRAGKPILAITARRKSPESIAEKMGSKGIKSKKAAKEQIHDFSGVRIIVSGKDKNAGNYVFDKLADAVKRGWISISEIEVFHNPELRPPYRYAYANEANIRKVEKTARKQGAKDFKLVTKSTESGYPAIHMLVNLPNNIKGELQIIGLNVLKLKDIEDLCYKVLTNKKLDTKYSDIETLLEQVRDNPEEYRDFMEYTREAYARERKKELGIETDSDFLHLPGGTEIPKELDFNNIPIMKKRANETTKLEKMRGVLDKYGELTDIDLYAELDDRKLLELARETCYSWVH